MIYRKYDYFIFMGFKIYHRIPKHSKTNYTNMSQNTSIYHHYSTYLCDQTKKYFHAWILLIIKNMLVDINIWAASWQNQSDQSSLCAQWVAKDPSFLHADSKDSDQTGWMPRLIRVFAGRSHFVGVISIQVSVQQIQILLKREINVCYVSDMGNFQG